MTTIQRKIETIDLILQSKTDFPQPPRVRTTRRLVHGPINSNPKIRPARRLVHGPTTTFFKSL